MINPFMLEPTYEIISRGPTVLRIICISRRFVERPSQIDATEIITYPQASMETRFHESLEWVDGMIFG